MCYARDFSGEKRNSRILRQLRSGIYDVSPRATVVLPRRLAAPWGRESILAGNRPEDSDNRDQPLAPEAPTDIYQLMIKELITHDPLSIHIHPDFHAAESIWNLRDESPPSESELARELQDVTDPRGKAESFFVAAARNDAVFYYGWNDEEITALRERLSITRSRVARGLAGRNLSSAILGNPRNLRLSDLLFKRANVELRRRRAEIQYICSHDGHWEEIETRFAKQYEFVARKWLDFVASKRSTTSPETLTCLLLVFALSAFQKVLVGSGHGVEKLFEQLLLGRNAGGQGKPGAEPDGCPLRDFFGTVGCTRTGTLITVPPGVPHGAGAGLHLIEISQNSFTTLRCYDHGRPRQLHPVLASIAMADLDSNASPLAHPATNTVDLGNDVSLGGRRFAILASCTGAAPESMSLIPGAVHVLVSLSEDMLVHRESGDVFVRVPGGHAAIIPPTKLHRHLRITPITGQWLLIRLHNDDYEPEH